MATLAPPPPGPLAADPDADGMLLDRDELDFLDPERMEQDIAEQNLQLAQLAEIPEGVRLFVEDLADTIGGLPAEAMLRTDPYLLVALQRSLLAAVRALNNSDPRAGRRELRVRLEQLRQVFRDLADARLIYENRPAKDLVRWLVETIDVPQARLAELFEVSPRTFQRWVSVGDESAPSGDEARRVRIVAQIVGHLRHALTGQGALEWLERPHPRIGGRSPKELLEDPDALTLLTRLAASTRSAIAS